MTPYRVRVAALMPSFYASNATAAITIAVSAKKQPTRIQTVHLKIGRFGRELAVVEVRLSPIASVFCKLWQKITVGAVIIATKRAAR